MTSGISRTASPLQNARQQPWGIQISGNGSLAPANTSYGKLIREFILRIYHKLNSEENRHACFSKEALMGLQRNYILQVEILTWMSAQHQIQIQEELKKLKLITSWQSLWGHWCPLTGNLFWRVLKKREIQSVRTSVFTLTKKIVFMVGMGWGTGGRGGRIKVLAL